jgi:hypothetical protein
MGIDLQKYFELLSRRFRTDVQAARFFVSSIDVGGINEQALSNVLIRLLPARYSIGVGEIIVPDAEDTAKISQSEQKDLVIYDPSVSPIFGWGESTLGLFPIESVYAVFEVKTCFHKVDDVRKAAGQVYQIKHLQQKYAPDVPPIFTVVFAFASAITSNSIFNTIQDTPYEERPDFLLSLGSDNPNEQNESAYITHWHYVNDGHGEIGFVTSEEALAARQGKDSRAIYLTLGETENALLWLYLFLTRRLQLIDSQADHPRFPNLFKYAISSKVHLGHKRDEKGILQEKGLL